MGVFYLLHAMKWCFVLLALVIFVSAVHADSPKEKAERLLRQSPKIQQYLDNIKSKSGSIRGLEEFLARSEELTERDEIPQEEEKIEIPTFQSVVLHPEINIVKNQVKQITAEHRAKLDNFMSSLEFK